MTEAQTKVASEVVQQYILTVKYEVPGYSSKTTLFLDMPPGSDCQEVYEQGQQQTLKSGGTPLPSIERVEFHRGQTEYHSPMVLKADQTAPVFLVALAR